jgi:hypothetical protein
MRNSSKGAETDGFWYLSAVNLMNAIVGLCAWDHEIDIITGYRHLLEQIRNTFEAQADAVQAVLDEIREDDISLVALREAVISHGMAAGMQGEVLEGACDKVASLARPFTIGAVLFRLLTMQDDERLQDQFSTLPLTHPAAVALQSYLNPGVSDVVRASARQGVMLRLQLFSDKSIRNICCNDEIRLEQAGRVQSAYFVITPDKSDAMKPLSSLFFSFAFKDLSDAWDMEQSRSQMPGETCRRIAVNVMCDEFYSIGYIPDFPVFISTCRKRRLYVTIILQSIGQLTSLYGEDLGATIQTCCDTVLFLGTNDLITANFVSDFAGDATVMTQSHQEGLHFFQPSESSSLSVAEGRRKLITPDEVLRTTNQVLLIRRGESVLKINRFGYTEHPAYLNSQIRPTSILQFGANDYSHKDSFNGATVRDIVAGRATGIHKPMVLMLRELELPGCPPAAPLPLEATSMAAAAQEMPPDSDHQGKGSRRKRMWNIDL